MIAVTGARGFVGRAVCDALTSRGHRVLTIGRGAESNVRWPARGAEFGAEALAALAGTRTVINLAGEPIDARWTAARMREIRASRVDSTAVLVRALSKLEPRPRVLISGSGVGYYGTRGDEWLDESSATGTDFLAAVCREWETAAAGAGAAGIRVVQMRLGVVIGAGGGMFSRVSKIFRLGLGGRLGSGAQWLSWIALDDLVRFIIRAIDDELLRGPVNVTGAAPVTNAVFTDTLARVLHRPAVMPAPAFVLRAVFGAMANDVLLGSQRVRPARLVALGFPFEHASLDDAFRAALR